MKKKILDCCIVYIKKNNTSYSEEELEQIRYGLEGIYIFLTKSIVIFGTAYFLHILKEVFLFTFIYNLIRMPSFGLHATKSWICFLSSLLIFIGIPYLCTFISLHLEIKIILGILATLFMGKYAPADTYKRPIINPKRRKTYKIISTILASIMAILSVVVRESFLSNAFLFALLTQCMIISPYTYRLFHLPYDNYKRYISIT